MTEPTRQNENGATVLHRSLAQLQQSFATLTPRLPMLDDSR
jgi:hypothetical protein